MAQAINTAFDQTVDQDVILEQLDGQPPAVQTTLKNAENVYKSFLYLRKMYSQFSAKEVLLDMHTETYAAYTAIVIPEKSNYVIVNSYSGAAAGIKINSKEYILQAGEKERFPIISPDSTSTPVVVGDVIELNGAVSYIIKNIQEY